MARRRYTSTAQPTSLSSPATNSTSTLNVVSTAGFPAVPFTIGVEVGTSNEEAMLVTNKTSTTFTVTRGFDGTGAKAHDAGSSVEHTSVALDFDEANRHIEDNTHDDHPQYLTPARAALMYPKTYSASNFSHVTTIDANYRQVLSLTIPSASFDRKIQVTGQVSMAFMLNDGLYLSRIVRNGTAVTMGFSTGLPILTHNLITPWITLASGSSNTFALQIKRQSGSGGRTENDEFNLYHQFTALAVPA